MDNVDDDDDNHENDEGSDPSDYSIRSALSRSLTSLEEGTPDYSSLAALAEAMEPDSQLASSPPLEAGSPDCEIVEANADSAVAQQKLAAEDREAERERIQVLLSNPKSESVPAAKGAVGSGGSSCGFNDTGIEATGNQGGHGATGSPADQAQTLELPDVPTGEARAAAAPDKALGDSVKIKPAEDYDEAAAEAKKSDQEKKNINKSIDDPEVALLLRQQQLELAEAKKRKTNPKGKPGDDEDEGDDGDRSEEDEEGDEDDDDDAPPKPRRSKAKAKAKAKPKAKAKGKAKAKAKARTKSNAKDSKDSDEDDAKKDKTKEGENGKSGDGEDSEPKRRTKRKKSTDEADGGKATFAKRAKPNTWPERWTCVRDVYMQFIKNKVQLQVWAEDLG
eukprot:s550_g7.t1